MVMQFVVLTLNSKYEICSFLSQSFCNMTESNSSKKFFLDFLPSILIEQTTTSRSKRIIVVVHDDTDMLKSFQEIAVEFPDIIKVFDNVEDSWNFIGNLSHINERDRKEVEAIVFVGGGFVHELVDEIHVFEPVKRIMILNKPPFDEEERKAMKQFSKVNKKNTVENN